MSRSEGLGRHDFDTDGTASFKDDFLDLGVTDQVQILVVCPSAVNICVSRVLATSSIAGNCQQSCKIDFKPLDLPIDPYLPVVCSLASGEVLLVIFEWYTQRFEGS